MQSCGCRVQHVHSAGGQEWMERVQLAPSVSTVCQSLPPTPWSPLFYTRLRRETTGPLFTRTCAGFYQWWSTSSRTRRCTSGCCWRRPARAMKADIESYITLHTGAAPYSTRSHPPRWWLTCAWKPSVKVHKLLFQQLTVFKIPGTWVSILVLDTVTTLFAVAVIRKEWTLTEILAGPAGGTVLAWGSW